MAARFPLFLPLFGSASRENSQINDGHLSTYDPLMNDIFGESPLLDSDPLMNDPLMNDIFGGSPLLDSEVDESLLLHGNAGGLNPSQHDPLNTDAYTPFGGAYAPMQEAPPPFQDVSGSGGLDNYGQVQASKYSEAHYGPSHLSSPQAGSSGGASGYSTDLLKSSAPLEFSAPLAASTPHSSGYYSAFDYLLTAPAPAYGGSASAAPYSENQVPIQPHVYQDHSGLTVTEKRDQQVPAEIFSSSSTQRAAHRPLESSAYQQQSHYQPQYQLQDEPLFPTPPSSDHQQQSAYTLSDGAATTEEELKRLAKLKKNAEQQKARRDKKKQEKLDGVAPSAPIIAQDELTEEELKRLATLRKKADQAKVRRDKKRQEKLDGGHDSHNQLPATSQQQPSTNGYSESSWDDIIPPGIMSQVSSIVDAVYPTPTVQQQGLPQQQPWMNGGHDSHN